MNHELIYKINEEIKGYYIFNSYQSLFLNCKTINEMIHVLHMYLVNSEYFYNNAQLIEEKTDENMNKISLHGYKTTLSKAIYDNLDFTIDSSIITILSLDNNHLLIMARDLGHATTIEIEVNENIAYVNYFIPKICNIDMVNKLKGITPLKPEENRNWAKGHFKTSLNDLIPTLISLLKNIPKDKDIIYNNRSL